MITSRRSFIAGIIGLVAAPAIVRASSLMPVKAIPADICNVDEIVALLNARIDAAKAIMEHNLAESVFAHSESHGALSEFLKKPSEVERWRTGSQYVRSDVCRSWWNGRGYQTNRDHLTAVGEVIVLNG